MKLTEKNKLYLVCGICTVAILLLLALSNKLGEDTGVVEENIIEETVTIIKEVIKKDPVLFDYVIVTDSCGPAYDGICVNVRSEPNITAPVVFKVRNGVVLQVSEKITAGGKDWYKLSFNEWLRFPERVKTDMYISADYVEFFKDEGNKELTASTTPHQKRILVDRSEQTLYAYDGDILFMKEKVSTGLKATPTPRGTFTVFKKTPSRYMQGPIEGISTSYYDLPGVPWNLYFTEQGAVIHGAYWHNNFGQAWSNGCVNLPIASAEKLYKWADVGTSVTVRD